MDSNSLARVEKEMDEYVYFEFEVYCLFSKNERIEFRRKTLTYIKGKKSIVYEISKMRNINNEKYQSVLSFSYPGNWIDISYNFGDQTNDIIEFLKSAQKGSYPAFNKIK